MQNVICQAVGLDAELVKFIELTPERTEAVIEALTFSVRRAAVFADELSDAFKSL